MLEDDVLTCLVASKKPIKAAGEVVYDSYILPLMPQATDVTVAPLFTCGI